MNDPRIPFTQAPEPPPPPPPPDHDAEYSATALASHWIQRPHNAAPEAAPDRVEGSILRFGPGVTAAAHHRDGRDSTATVWHGTLPGRTPLPPQRRTRRFAGLRRYALAAVVLLGALAFLAWQRYGPTVAVRGVSVQSAPQGPECDGTADITAVVRTDGRPGTLTYRWLRSDGTTSGELRERVSRGQHEARLHLLWTFHGRGDYRARAELRITSPTPHTAATGFTYSCP
ncbi:hypothetical protein NLX86_21695 [Streptomyces sp. A3M-1-3]|uniref:hypothetical protein n=1 Tax=Streptomyces sp. A3M-1-3 TaxID=2962044 RepID=UPI0020B8E290|nr:hypothetical protein [Streptomyces sp. A3M-1-3]MCP3820613.1 hypothetical protein [Streptomyces sp. A3M-1-3]